MILHYSKYRTAIYYFPSLSIKKGGFFDQTGFQVVDIDVFPQILSFIKYIIIHI